MSAMVRPFSNGTEADVWEEHNCVRCHHRGGCKLEDAIGDGRITGTIPADLATKFGGTVREGYADLPFICGGFVSTVLFRVEWDRATDTHSARCQLCRKTFPTPAQAGLHARLHVRRGEATERTDREHPIQDRYAIPAERTPEKAAVVEP